MDDSQVTENRARAASVRDGKKAAPRLSEVATRAGVGIAAVSAVLNGSTKGTRVSEATRQRILAAATELRYRPNANARSLRRNRTDILGFYSGDSFIDVSAPFVSQIISGLQLGCRQHGKDLLFQGEQVVSDPAMESSQIRQDVRGSVEDVYGSLTGGRTDGLLLYAAPQDPLVGMLAASHLPVVAIADAIPGIPSVGVDDALGGRLQAEHLAQKGHRRILYHSPPDAPTSVLRRADAFCRVAAEYGISVVRHEALLFYTSAPDTATGLFPAFDAVTDHKPGLAEEAARLARAVLANAGSDGERISAVVCWEDLAAYRLLNALDALGAKVPEEIAVMGFDGITASPIRQIWRVTTVHAPWRDVARTAVSLLVDQIEGKEAPPETLLPVEFVLGDTT